MHSVVYTWTITVHKKVALRHNKIRAFSIPYHQHSVKIMHIPVLPASNVLCVLVHGDFWSIEHGRFIHVVPDKQIRKGSLVEIRVKLASPPPLHSRTKKVWPSGVTCTTTRKVRIFYTVHKIQITGEQTSQAEISFSFVRLAAPSPFSA